MRVEGREKDVVSGIGCARGTEYDTVQPPQTTAVPPKALANDSLYSTAVHGAGSAFSRDCQTQPIGADAVGSSHDCKECVPGDQRPPEYVSELGGS